MFFSSWLRKPTATARAARNSRERARSPHFRPRVEPLEGRALLATLTVTTPLDVVDPQDGQLSLREAIIQANSTQGADQIELPRGTYTLGIPGAYEDAGLTGDLDITGRLTIRGAGAGLTVVDAAALDRAFEVLGGADVTLSGIAIRNGSALLGGGVFNRGKLTIDACTVADNVAEYWGGGIANLGDSLTVVDSTIANNTVSGTGGGSLGGGGIGNSGKLAVDRTTFTGNSVLSRRTESWGGGAVLTDSSDVSVRDSAFVGNSSNTLGGAVSVINYGGATSNLTVINSTFTDNRAVWGGGAIYVDYYNASANLIGCTFTGNSARDLGGAIYSNGVLTMTNCLLTDNSAGGAGGIHAIGLTLRHCIIVGNRATDPFGYGADVLGPANSFIANCDIRDLYLQ